MNLPKKCSDLVSILRSQLKNIKINIFNGGGYSAHPFIRIKSNVNIAIDTKSTIRINKGVLISSNSVISATDGGHLTIGSMVGINRNSMIMCHDKISIGDNTIMGPGVYIYDHDHQFNADNGVKRNEYVTYPISIGKNCWIGAGTIILKGTKIGNNCLIAAGSVVKGNISDGSIVIQKREEFIKRN